MENKVVDHLFRHQYGKMVAILTRFFGLSHLETIEDAVQDTFIKATLQWRNNIPDKPEAWLIKAAKNRTLDLLRKIKTEKNRFGKAATGSSFIQMNELFLDHEVEDSQLRMIFVACHPSLDAKEQIAFALKTIAGFSIKEIASALLLKEETIKKRLSRARKTIAQKKISFDFPSETEIKSRLFRVMEVVYLTFNEGFHSNNKNHLVRKDLCGEALRLNKLLLKMESLRSGALYALFALMCFQASRLESKTNSENEFVDLQHQDRTKWHWPLIEIGNNAMNKSVAYNDISMYQYEAAIAAEHLKAKTFEDTNWNKIRYWYQQLNLYQPTPTSQLNMAVVQIQLGQYTSAKQQMDGINLKELENRGYLLFGCYAAYFEKTGEIEKAIINFNKAILLVSNEHEKTHLIKKRNKLMQT